MTTWPSVGTVKDNSWVGSSRPIPSLQFAAVPMHQHPNDHGTQLAQMDAEIFVMSLQTPRFDFTAAPAGRITYKELVRLANETTGSVHRVSGRAASTTEGLRAVLGAQGGQEGGWKLYVTLSVWYLDDGKAVFPPQPPAPRAPSPCPHPPICSGALFDGLHMTPMSMVCVCPTVPQVPCLK